VLQQETDYLDLNIPVFGSKVIQWNGENILIFSSQSDGYIVTDITDLGQSVVNQLSTAGTTQSTTWGIIYNLPQAIEDTISSDATVAINVAKSAGAGAAGIAQSVADAVGKTIANLVGPLAGTLTPIIAIVAIGLLLIYLPKKG
jgi:hypothetical protein